MKSLRSYRKYRRLLAVQVRASVLLALQYRLDAAFDAAVELFYAATALVPLLVVFGTRGTVAGWSYPESLLVVGWFTLLQTVLDAMIVPGLTAVVEHVRKGTLDFVLLKPADAEFLVSTARFQPTRFTNVITAGLIFAYAFHQLGRGPSPVGIVVALVLLAFATVVLHSLLIMAIAASFYVVRVDNLAYLFTSVFDAARWPRSVFRGVAHVLFTFVLPFAMMTSYPAEALLGQLPPGRLLFALLGAGAFALLARIVWNRALGRYTSASS
jgi:ABC-2 type transport system permease protein